MADAPEDRREIRSAQERTSAERDGGGGEPDRRRRPDRRRVDASPSRTPDAEQPRAVHACEQGQQASEPRAARSSRESGDRSHHQGAHGEDGARDARRAERPGRADRGEQRERPRRRSDRAREQPATMGSRARQREAPERRSDRSLHEKRQYWSGVRREMERYKLDPFMQLLTQLAQVVFGPSASVMPHLRGRQRQRHLAFVVDAAHPEALSSYEDFLPLEKQFWTAYGTLPKPAAPFLVAIRPARGWVRNEALAPIYTEFGNAELLS